MNKNVKDNRFVIGYRRRDFSRKIFNYLSANQEKYLS